MEPGGWRVTLKWYRVPFGADENVLKLIVVMVAQPGEYTKNHELYTLNEWIISQ